MRGIDIRCHHHMGEVRLDDAPSALDTVASLFKTRKITIPCVLCYNAWPERAGGDWESAARELESMMALAARLDARAVRLFPRLPKNVGEQEAYVNEAGRMLRQTLADSASEVSVYLQNHAGSLNARQTAALCERVGQKRLGMVYSPDHAVMMAEPPEGLLPTVASCVKEVFIADIDARGKTVSPGCGVVPLKETVYFFRERGFEGFFSFKWEKIWHPELADAAEALPKFALFMEPFR